jgi:hypothetical protein
MTGIIGYANLWPDATVTASAEATGFEKENAYDWIGATAWKPGATGTQTLAAVFGSAQDVDYMAIAAHNLGSEGATVTFQYHNGSTWADLFTGITPSDNRPIFRYTASGQSRTQYRIEITNCTADTVIGIAAMGQALPLPSAIEPGAWAPAPYARDTVTDTHESQGGVFLGRSIKRLGITGELKQTLVTPAWIAANWPGFVAHAEKRNFFYGWDYDNAPDEVALVWGPGKIKPPTRYMHNFYQFTIPLRGSFS